MKKYNLFILLPNISDQDIEVAKSEISELIKKIDAQVDLIEDIGKRKLSYVIKKIRHGFYLNYVLKLDLDKMKNLEKELKLNEHILRYELSLCTKTLKHKNIKTQKHLNTRTPSHDNALDGRLDGRQDSKSKREKVSMEELNKKLDNILEDDIK